MRYQMDLEELFTILYTVNIVFCTFKWTAMSSRKNEVQVVGSEVSVDTMAIIISFFSNELFMNYGRLSDRI